MKNECPECKVIVTATNGHGRTCSEYVAPAPINWAADGFLRDRAGRIEGFPLTCGTTAEDARERAALAYFDTDLCTDVCRATLMHQTEACEAAAEIEAREFQVWYRGAAA